MSGDQQRFDLTREAQEDGGYDSTNEDDHYSKSRKRGRYDLTSKGKRDPTKHAKGSKEVFRAEAAMEEGRKQRLNLLSLSAYDRHKQLVNTYQLYHKGATAKLERDKSRDKRDIDIIQEHHRFLWDDDEEDGSSGETSWEVALAKRYYGKLFKEYCIIDVSKYKENKFGMRWRLEKEVVIGKGQFVCANKKCEEVKKLRTWEVNFAYVEQGAKKNALVKCRLCFECSYKLNYTHKKKDVTKRNKKRAKSKKRKKKKKRRKRDDSSSGSDSSSDDSSDAGEGTSTAENAAKKKADEEKSAADIWSRPVNREEDKPREEVLDQFLEDLFM